MTDEDLGAGQLRNATRQNIMRLLLSTIDHPAPNLAHFLLGFETRKPVSKTNLQDPGMFTLFYATENIEVWHIECFVGIQNTKKYTIFENRALSYPRKIK